MKTYDQQDPHLGPPRSHPWAGSSTDPRSRYIDFKSDPQLIRSSLEDLAPWSAWPAAETFYQLVEWINSRDCVLESNDCAFTGPGANETMQIDKSFECTGRLMVLWRDLSLNTSIDHIEWFRTAIHRHLNEADLSFEWGAVGITIVRTRYLALPTGQRAGSQLLLSFWAWGETEAEVMDNVDRVFRNLYAALREVDREARASSGR